MILRSPQACGCTRRMACQFVWMPLGDAQMQSCSTEDPPSGCNQPHPHNTDLQSCIRRKWMRRGTNLPTKQMKVSHQRCCSNLFFWPSDQPRNTNTVIDSFSTRYNNVTVTLECLVEEPLRRENVSCSSRSTFLKHYLLFNV